MGALIENQLVTRIKKELGEYFSHVHYRDTASIPEDYGVYLISDFKELFYVGFSSNLRKRFSRRRRIFDVINKPYVYIIYRVTDTIEQARTLETHLIKLFQPTLNVSLKSSKSQILKFRTTIEERRLITDVCEDENLTVSDLIRKAIFFYVEARDYLPAMKDISRLVEKLNLIQ